MPGRNDPCPCGSGKKYKKCCQEKFGNRPSPGFGQQQAHAAAGARTPPPAELNQLILLFKAGRHAELEARICSLLGRYPDSGLAWKMLGATLQALGKDSLPALRRAAELLPGDADAHCDLGNALGGLGRLDEAEVGYRRALRIRPDFADAHGNLGNIMQKQGRLEEAEACYRQTLRLKPGHVAAHYNLGNILHDLGRLEEAEASYRLALQAAPEFAEGRFNLGNVLRDLGRLGEAEASYREAIRIRPGYSRAHGNLGNALLNMGRLDEAENCFRQALHLEPDCAELHNNLGHTLFEQGRLGEAEASLRRAIQLRPDLHVAHYIMGVALNEQGRIDEAKACFHQAIRIKPDYVDARYNLALTEKAKAEGENLAALVSIEEAVRSGAASLQANEAEFMHFALGKCYDDIGEYGKAFAHFLEGGRLKRATLDYDPDRVDRQFSAIRQGFSRETIDRLRGGGDPSHLPIFVLGMPRSGTTLTEQIIASHPEVHGAGELPDLMAIAKRDIEGVAFPDNMRLLDPAKLAAWGAEYVAGLQRCAPEARYITDKMLANFLAIGLIHPMLPNARIIHVNRNPADTCLSCFATLFKHGQEYTYDLTELGRYYANYARLMEHWRKVLPEGAFLDVQYEDIVADQEAQARRIIEYCGLEWHDACLDFHRNKRAVRTASMTQVRQSLYKSSVERWRSHEKSLAPLFEALGEFAPDCQKGVA